MIRSYNTDDKDWIFKGGGGSYIHKIVQTVYQPLNLYFVGLKAVCALF